MGRRRRLFVFFISRSHTESGVKAAKRKEGSMALGWGAAPWEACESWWAESQRGGRGGCGCAEVKQRNPGRDRRERGARAVGRDAGSGGERCGNEVLGAQRRGVRRL